MAVYVVGAIEIHDASGYAQYSEFSRKAMQEFAAAGHEIEAISLDNNPKMYEGTQPANHLMIIKFASREDYEAFVASETYQRGLPFRLASSTSQFIMAMDPA